MEEEYAPLYADLGMGTTTWSPLASGLLTGKYAQGIPEGSRGTLKGLEWLRKGLTDAEKNAAVQRLKPAADELGCTLAQLAIAWCLKNPHVSSVITGASRPDQVRENLKALDVAKKLDAAVMSRIDAALQG
ncbi:MAG: aldo/keto reductase [Polyangiales bacterium]